MEQTVDAKVRINKEKYRPQFHFSPQSGWMNDPNGLVYYKGEYHLYFQFNPHDIVWGPMHWGHAVSRDLMHWEYLPIVFEPENPQSDYFSGCAVVDWNNTSGFFDGHGGEGIVAVFTHRENGIQTQGVAYSIDNGRSFINYEGNPVIPNPGIEDFRDPQVFWHSEANRWVMAVACYDRVWFYSSPDLRNWNYESEFGANDGLHVGPWECPDLYELPVDGEPKKKWVLHVGDSLASRTQYFIGEFDGTTFVNDNPPETVLLLDYGKDNYAGMTWNDIPEEDSRCIFIAWMQGSEVRDCTPTFPWRGEHTIPRELTLKTFSEGIRLVQNPVKEIECLRIPKVNWAKRLITPGSNLLEGIHGNELEIIAEFQMDTEIPSEFGFRVAAGEDQYTIIGYDVKKSKLFMDRSKSGNTSFCPKFDLFHEAPLSPDNGKIKIRIILDWSSVEVFGNDGKVAITGLIFPDNTKDGLELYSKEGNVILSSLKIYYIKSIWDK